VPKKWREVRPRQGAQESPVPVKGPRCRRKHTRRAHDAAYLEQLGQIQDGTSPLVQRDDYSSRWRF